MFALSLHSPLMQKNVKRPPPPWKCFYTQERKGRACEIAGDGSEIESSAENEGSPRAFECQPKRK